MNQRESRIGEAALRLYIESGELDNFPCDVDLELIYCLLL